MQSMFDERSWLAWLVKVRIIILTFLLGIELAITRLTPTTLPLRLFIQTMLLWYTVSIFFLVLLSFWNEQRIQSLLRSSPICSWSRWWSTPREGWKVR